MEIGGYLMHYGKKYWKHLDERSFKIYLPGVEYKKNDSSSDGQTEDE